MAVELSYRHMGGEGNPPLVVVHGLLGSSRNWSTVGKALAEHYEVFVVDVRNHGESPHVDGMAYADLVDDLRALIERLGLSDVTLLGHSLGGKVAMAYAVRYATEVRALFVVDIAPKDYRPHHTDEFAAMLELDLDTLKSRKQADEQLSVKVPDWGMRQFLLTNLQRTPADGFAWSVNLTALAEAQSIVCLNSLCLGESYAGPVLFILGERSDFFCEGDQETVQKYFPQAEFETIAESGHNPHVEKREAFLQAVLNFRAQL